MQTSRHRRARFVVRALRRRWWLAGTIFLLSCGLVGVMVSRQSDPVRYRSTAFVRVTESAARTTIPGSSAQVAQARQVLRLALSAAVRRQALLGSDLPAGDSQIGFDAKLNSTDTIVALTATAPTPTEATTVAAQWTNAFSAARGDAEPQILQ